MKSGSRSLPKKGVAHNTAQSSFQKPGYLALWIAGHFGIGCAIQILIEIFPPFLAGQYHPAGFGWGALNALIFGFCLGFGQVLLFQRRIDALRLIDGLVWGSPIAWVVAWLAVTGLISTLQTAVTPLLNLFFVLFQGLLLGLAQWWFLRRVFQKAGWWILATSLGLFAGTMLVSALFSQAAVGKMTQWDVTLANILVRGITLLVLGGCTALTFWGMKPTANSPQPTADS